MLIVGLCPLWLCFSITFNSETTMTMTVLPTQLTPTVPVVSLVRCQCSTLFVNSRWKAACSCHGRRPLTRTRHLDATSVLWGLHCASPVTPRTCLHHAVTRSRRLTPDIYCRRLSTRPPQPPLDIHNVDQPQLHQIVAASSPMNSTCCCHQHDMCAATGMQHFVYITYWMCVTWTYVVVCPSHKRRWITTCALIFKCLLVKFHFIPLTKHYHFSCTFLCVNLLH